MRWQPSSVSWQEVWVYSVNGRKDSSRGTSHSGLEFSRTRVFQDMGL